MISVLIPFHNEKENLPILFDELVSVLDTINQEYELVFIDDGSTDQSREAIAARIDNKKAVLVTPRTRQGKGPALGAGLKQAKGDIIFFMDGDLQDDPKDIPAFLAKINEGYDLVNGIRAKRKHNVILKTLSLLGNGFVKLFSRSPFTDVNCGFKAFRKEVLNDFVLYGNNFRFLPLAVFYKGYKVTEIPVNNRQRIHGQPKFGISKVFIGFIDTITATFLYQFAEKPLHFFGMIGSFFFIPGFLLMAYMTFERIFFNVLLYRRPALIYAVLFIIVGIQIAMTGIIGELIVYLNKRNNK